MTTATAGATTATEQWRATAALTLVARGLVRWDMRHDRWVTHLADGHPTQEWSEPISSHLHDAHLYNLIRVRPNWVAELSSNGQLALTVYLYRALAAAVTR